MRADELLAELMLVESRSKARALIEEGKVRADGVRIDKASRKISPDAKIEIDSDAAATRYVSRAGLKIEEYIRVFKTPVEGCEILDIGASTGGFTDCLLQHGAVSAVCVDVGSNQLHEKLRSDVRVRNMEQTDARSLTPELLENRSFDILAADLSFISLDKVLPDIWPFVKRWGIAILLVKPQFETHPSLLRRTKGIVKDEKLQKEALSKVKDFLSANFSDAQIEGEIRSPIKGGDGNVEFLIGVRKL